MNETTSKLSAAIHKTHVLIRVDGRASFSAAPTLKEFATGCISKGHDSLILDMDRCENVDSTFLGVLAGIAIRLKAACPDGRMCLVNLSDKLMDAFTTLGLDQMLELFSPENTPEDIGRLLRVSENSEHIGDGPADRDSARSTMIEAHETLSELSSDNAAKFRSLLDILRESQ